MALVEHVIPGQVVQHMPVLGGRRMMGRAALVTLALVARCTKALAETLILDQGVRCIMGRVAPLTMDREGLRIGDQAALVITDREGRATQAPAVVMNALRYAVDVRRPRISPGNSSPWYQQDLIAEFTLLLSNDQRPSEGSR